MPERPKIVGEKKREIKEKKPPKRILISWEPGSKKEEEENLKKFILEYREG